MFIELIIAISAYSCTQRESWFGASMCDIMAYHDALRNELRDLHNLSHF